VASPVLAGDEPETDSTFIRAGSLKAWQEEQACIQQEADDEAAQKESDQSEKKSGVSVRVTF